MAERSQPWNATGGGDNGPYGYDVWQEMFRAREAPDATWLGVTNPVYGGVHRNYKNELRVKATSPASASVEISTGRATVYGADYENTAVLTQAITANASGSTRYDVIGLQWDKSNQVVRQFYRTGTTSPPALTTDPTVTGIVEIPLAYIAVGNGFVSISQAAIHNCAASAGVPDRIEINCALSGATAVNLEGLVLHWDTTAPNTVQNRGVSTPGLSSNDWSVHPAGISAQMYGETCRIVVRGYCVAYVSGTFAEGDLLVCNAQGVLSRRYLTNKAVNIGNGPTGENIVAWVVDATNFGSNKALVYVDFTAWNNTSWKTPHLLFEHRMTSTGNAGTLTATTWTTRPITGITNNLHQTVALGSNEITLPAGRYRIHCQAPGYNCGTHQIRLYDVTGSAPLAHGTIGYSATTDDDMGLSVMEDTFELGVQSNVRIEHNCSSTQLNSGMGFAASWASATDPSIIMSGYIEAI